MRVFVAIDIDKQTRESIGKLSSALQERAHLHKGDAKWVDPDVMHLTLKFLGEIPDEQVADVCRVVESVAANHKRFDLDFEKVGSFGGKSANVLWVGAGEGAQQLVELANDIDRYLGDAGWPTETRKFEGHLTLCRVRNFIAGKKLVKLSEDYADFVAPVTSVDSVVVYQSDLTPKGPVYAALGTYKLQE
jgi:RNA 2',3'-cyclic 3'-phosphodiesterase